MTPAARITYAMALIIGLCGGALFGFSNDAGRLKSYYSLSLVTAPMVLDDFSFMQYRHADAENARVALLASASLMERLEALRPDTGQSFFLASTFVRLALLEDATNDAQASHDYMAKAQYWYSAGGGRRYSDSELKSAVSEKDKWLERLGIR